MREAVALCVRGGFVGPGGFCRRSTASVSSVIVGVVTASSPLWTESLFLFVFLDFFFLLVPLPKSMVWYVCRNRNRRTEG